MYVVMLILKPTGDQHHDITGFCKLLFFLFISFDEFFSWEQFHGKISFHSHFLADTFTDNNILAFFLATLPKPNGHYGKKLTWRAD